MSFDCDLGVSRLHLTPMISSAPSVICHGGAGHKQRDQPSVASACRAAQEILEAGGSALDAVLKAITMMEDDPNPNAGTGGRIREDGSVQLDAAIMTSDGRFGAVVCIEETKNPVLVAATILDLEINMLAGRGAREHADRVGFARDNVQGSNRPPANDTVGAVARDSSGLIVVASSTGGCIGRPSGRVGDTPLIGAGLWCDKNIGIAATGIGEAITLKVPCVRVADRFAQSQKLQDELDWGINMFDPSIEVGLIALSSEGPGLASTNTTMPWSTLGGGQ